MNVPELLGSDVSTPDGSGYILSLHNGRVIVHLHSIELNQVMIGRRRFPGNMKYSYDYRDVTVI